MWNCVHTDCKYGRRGRARKGGRVGLILGSPLERRRRTWRLGGLEREWPTQVLSSSFCVLYSRLPGCLPTSTPAPYMYICGLAPPSSSSRDSSTTDARISSHLIFQQPAFHSHSHSHFPIPIFIPLTHHLFLNLLLHLHCLCVSGTIICLLALLTCYHSTAHSRSG